MAVIYDVAVKEMMNAYFSDYSITQLSRAFDRIVTEFNYRGLLAIKKSTDVPNELLKYLLALLFTTLVEHGQMDNTSRFSGNAGNITASICNIDGFRTYCEKLGRHYDYQSWTHMILYLISVFRQGKFILIYDPKSGMTNPEEFDMDLSGVSAAFLSNVILMLYGILITRLVISAMNLPGVEDRYNVEACMFATLLSFYYDYVMYTKNLDTTASQRHWELLLQEINRTYLQPGRFFVTFKLRFNLKSYLDQDNIVGFYACINKNFLLKYKKMLTFTTGLGMEATSIDTAMICLMNINLNSLSMVYNRWFRYIVYSKFMKQGNDDLNLVKGVVKGAYGGVRDAIMLGYGVYSNVYSDRWPVASTTSGVTIGIVAFTGSLYASFVKNRLKWGWKQLTAATVYAFKKKQLIPDRPNIQISFERPRSPAYLVWDRNPNGSYSVIYNRTPLPTVRMNTNEPLVFRHQGGAKGNVRKDTKPTVADQNLKALAEAMKKGYIKNILAPEMAILIKNKLALKTKMTGGAEAGNKANISELLEIENQTDPLPLGWIREIIDVADDEAFYDEEGETGRFVLPKPRMEKEALEEAAFVDVSEPAIDNEFPPPNEYSLPPPLHELDNSKLSKGFKVGRLSKDIPRPPIDPALSIPTKSRRKDTVVFTRRIRR